MSLIRSNQWRALHKIVPSQLSRLVKSCYIYALISERISRTTDIYKKNPSGEDLNNFQVINLSILSEYLKILQESNRLEKEKDFNKVSTDIHTSLSGWFTDKLRLKNMTQDFMIPISRGTMDFFFPLFRAPNDGIVQHKIYESLIEGYEESQVFLSKKFFNSPPKKFYMAKKEYNWFQLSILVPINLKRLCILCYDIQEMIQSLEESAPSYSLEEEDILNKVIYDIIDSYLNYHKTIPIQDGTQLNEFMTEYIYYPLIEALESSQNVWYNNFIISTINKAGLYPQFSKSEEIKLPSIKKGED